MWPVVRRLLLALGVCLFAQAAFAQQAPLVPFNKTFQGTGSPGFLPTCQGSFYISNAVYGSDNTHIGSAPWSTTPVAGGGTVTVTSSSDTAPDGSATAVDVSIGGISGATQASILSQSVGSTAFAKYYSWTDQAWVKVITPPSPGHFSMSIYNGGAGAQGALSGSVNYATTAIPNDGQWHLLANFIPANWTTANTVTFEFGADGRDPTQPSTVGSGALAIWEPQFAQGHSEGGKGWPYVPNTSTSAPSSPSIFTLTCPSSIAFRDFSQFRPLITALNNAHGVAQITVQSGSAAIGNVSTAGLYQRGGLGNPFTGSSVAFQASGTYKGQLCGFTSATDGTVNSTNHNNWPDSILFCGKNMASFQEAQVGYPQLLIPGFTLATTSTNTTGGLSPCPSSCTSAAAGVTVANTSVSISTSGVVTITMPASINPGPGANIAVSGFTGTNAAYVNGNFMAIAPTGGGTTTVTYQGNCTTSCTIALNTGNGAVGYSVPWNSYTLHGSWVPQTGGVGCKVNSVPYTYCMMFSGEANANGGGVPSTFLAYSNTIDSGYCVYNSFFPSHCNNGSPTAADGGGSPNQPTGILVSPNSNVGSVQLPTLLCMPVGCPTGATLYAITPPTNQNNSGFVLWQSTAGLATSWTTAGWITQPVFGAQFQGTIASNVLTTTSTIGSLQVGQTLTGAGVTAGTTIVSYGTGTGGNGTYNVTSTPNVTTAEAMTTAWPAQTDWDQGATRIDPFFYLNKCGFFEGFWTSFKGSEWQPPTGGTAAKRDQGIGYAVASDIRGPWYRLNNAYWAPVGNGSGVVSGPTGAIISFNSPIYNSLSTIGETNVWDDAQGNLNLTFNTDSGSVFSSGVGAVMHDYCQ